MVTFQSILHDLACVHEELLNRTTLAGHWRVVNASDDESNTALMFAFRIVDPVCAAPARVNVVMVANKVKRVYPRVQEGVVQLRMPLKSWHGFKLKA